MNDLWPQPIAAAFTAAGSHPTAIDAKFAVADSLPIRIDLFARDGPQRSLAHITLERITIAGSRETYFQLAQILVGLARSACEEGASTAMVHLAASSEFRELLCSAWSNMSNAGSSELTRGAPVRLPRPVRWIAPFCNWPMEKGLPSIGIIRERLPSGVCHPDVPLDGTVMYIGASAEACLMLGKLIAALAVEGDDAFLQFEHSLGDSGVSRHSYELECLLDTSFAAQSLFCLPD
jgi:hypothetical protein